MVFRRSTLYLKRRRLSAPEGLFCQFGLGFLVRKFTSSCNSIGYFVLLYDSQLVWLKHAVRYSSVSFVCSLHLTLQNKYRSLCFIPSETCRQFKHSCYFVLIIPWVCASSLLWEAAPIYRKIKKHIFGSRPYRSLVLFFIRLIKNWTKLLTNAEAT